MAKKYFRKGMALFLSLTMCLSLLNLSVLAATGSSAQQVVNAGGSATSTDGKVTVSKTIEGTPFENYFDITLAVETPVSSTELIDKMDTDVIIVMDISATMGQEINGVDNLRYDSAMNAASSFVGSLKTSAAQLPEGVNVRLGFVAFNTDGHEVMALKEVGSVNFNRDIKAWTNNVINASNYGTSGTRYTNIEGGLQAAQNMFASSTAQNKKIVFISDGFPTTWSPAANSIIGIVPNASDVNSKMHGYKDRIFYTTPYGGTSYSETGARQATAKATALKNAGVEIYSVGVALGDQTIKGYVNQNLDSGFTVVEVPSNWNNKWSFAWDTKTGFTTWLKDSIGSGMYWNASNVSEMSAVFNKVLNDIKTQTNNVLASWVASDPMSTSAPSAVDFIGFYNKDGRYTAAQSLSGSAVAGGEDTASVSVKDGIESITWNLILSGYSYDDETKTYTYSIKYRVRLANEMGGFVADDNDESTLADIYETNGVTTLKYVDEVKVNGQVVSSTEKSINFPIPSVKGHLGELSFTKMDGDNGVALAGAKFTLTHSGENCAVCEAADYHVNVPAKMQVSDDNGAVRFSGIPSGHSYLLTETEAPVGYWSGGNDNTWDVVVGYGSTVIRNANGSASNPEIHNYLIPPEYVEWTPEALKVTEEFDLEAGDFTFVLKNEAGDVISTATNDADGNVQFPTHYFTQPGTYVYYMSEVAGDNDDIIYDSSVYKYTVTVTLESDIIVIPQPVDHAPADPGDSYTQDSDTDPVVPADGDTPSGDNGDVPSGDSGDAPAGDNGDIPSGDNGDAPAGDNGDVPSDDSGDVPSDDNGDAPAGDNSDAPAGDNSDAPAGDNPQPTVQNSLSRALRSIGSVIKMSLVDLSDPTDSDVPSDDNSDFLSDDSGDIPSDDSGDSYNQNGDTNVGDNLYNPSSDTTISNDIYSLNNDTNVGGNGNIYSMNNDTNVSDSTYDQKEDTVLVDGVEVPKADIPQRPVDAPDAVTWLEISISVEKDGTAESNPVAQFTNKLAPPPPPPGNNPPPPSGPVYVSRFVNKVWNDNGNAYGLRPDSITVNLMVNGMVYESVELSASNGWSFVWSGLDAEQDWTVEEAEVPEGYVSTVSSSGNRYTITNSLPGEELPPPEEELPPPEEGGNNGGGNGELEELPEEEVPLADIPVTGDPMTLYAISAALSGLGLAWLGLKKKEEDEV